jgi:hypothetical protein
LWADLMRRAFDLDGLARHRCGGRMRLLAPSVLKFSLDSFRFRPLSLPYPPFVYPTRKRTGRDVWCVE